MTEQEEKDLFVQTEMLSVLQKTCPDVTGAGYEEEADGNFVYLDFADGTMARIAVGGGTDSMIYEVACALKEAGRT